MAIVNPVYGKELKLEALKCIPIGERSKIQTLVEGFSPKGYANLSCRLVNLFFFYRIFFYQMVLVSTQNCPWLAISLLMLVTLMSACNFLYCLRNRFFFASVLSMLQKLSLEMCILSCVLQISLHSLAINTVGLDYLVISLTAICIVFQVTVSIHSVFLTMRPCLRKQRLRPVISATVSHDNRRVKSDTTLTNPLKSRKFGRKSIVPLAKLSLGTKTYLTEGSARLKTLSRHDLSKKKLTSTTAAKVNRTLKTTTTMAELDGVTSRLQLQRQVSAARELLTLSDLPDISSRSANRIRGRTLTLSLHPVKI